MLATFVIGLREGLEAALIVGIVGGFLRRRGDRAALRPMWAGVVLAVLICIAVAVVLEVVSADLPQQEQEGLETVIGLVAVAMITYMIVWMRKHARSMRGELEAAAESALAKGSTWALVGMAFLAVLREGFETTVFLLAAFQSSTSPVAAGGGALLGILIAIGLGYGIYRGAVHIDLARFFTVTAVFLAVLREGFETTVFLLAAFQSSTSPVAAGGGALLGILIAIGLGYGIYRGAVRIDLARFFTVTAVFLVLVAAGLLVSAVHTAHEATWVNVWQEPVADLSAVVQPGTPIASLLTGVLGIQPQPTLIEVVVWVLYLVPMLVFVLWPTRRAAGSRAAAPAAA